MLLHAYRTASTPLKKDYSDGIKHVVTIIVITPYSKRNNIDDMIFLLELKIVWQSSEGAAQK